MGVFVNNSNTIKNKKTSTFCIFASIFFGLFLIFCIGTYFSKTHIDIKEDIEAAFYHQSGRYSVIVKGENEELISVSMPNWLDIETKVFTDVKEGEKNWYRVKYTRNNFNGIESDESNLAEIHIKSVDDLNPADWNYGKFGSGKTEKICCDEE